MYCKLNCIPYFIKRTLTIMMLGRFSKMSRFKRLINYYIICCTILYYNNCNHKLNQYDDYY